MRMPRTEMVWGWYRFRVQGVMGGRQLRPEEDKHTQISWPDVLKSHGLIQPMVPS